MEPLDLRNKIEDTINSLNDVQKAQPRPFFYTRLMARMNNEESGAWNVLVSLVTRPTIVFAGLILIIFVNVMAAFHETKKRVIPENMEQVYADDYTMNTTSLYDYENPEQ